MNVKNILNLEKQFKNPGIHTVNWDGKNKEGIKISTGVYIYRLILNGIQVDSKKMLLLY